MYIAKYDQLGESSNESLLSSTINDADADSDNQNFMKFTSKGIKKAYHCICRVAEGTEASQNKVRILVDIKDGTTVEGLKSCISDS